MNITIRKTMKSLVAAAAALAAVACANYKIIPDRTLAEIFHDAFLTNAYIENRRFSLDSLDIYQPVFEKYGYTTEDVQYTIGNFSKRKSARLGDVVEQAIARLEEEGLVYEREVAVLDTIDNIARRRFTRVLYADSLIEVPKLRDTGRLVIVLDNIRSGEYRISYSYKVDSLDNNTSRRSVFEFERADSSRTGRTVQTLYKRTSPERITKNITADTSARRLHINLMEFTPPKKDDRTAGKNAKKERDHTGITVTDFSVTYIPDAAQAVDSLFESQMPLRIFSDRFIPAPALRGDPATAADADSTTVAAVTAVSDSADSEQ